MAKQKKVIFYVLAALFSIMLMICVSGALSSTERQKPTKNEPVVSLLASELGTVDIVTKDGSPYKLIYSSDANQSDQLIANNIAKLIRNGTGKVYSAYSDASVKESELEILIGNTNRFASAQLLNLIESYGSSDEVLVWGYFYKNGKLAFAANCDQALEMGSSEFLSLFASNGTLSVSSDLLYINSKNIAEYEEELRREEEEKRQEYINELLAMNEAFKQYNTNAYKPMIAEDGSGYYKKPISGEPWIYPTANQHPRFLITADSIEALKKMLAKNQSEDSEYYYLARNFWRLADALPSEFCYGIFPEVTASSGNTYRYDDEILTMIDSKALAYLITGDEVYALEAIIGIKNAILSLKYTTDLHMDTYHGASNVMIILAAVYDWCYDYLTEEDKWQMITACALVLGSQLEEEMHYPPKGMSAVSGHGTGPQLLRDWMTVSIVFYDEAPDWYRFVAGRFFNEYLPVHNVQYEGGWVSQGTANYIDGKIAYSAWAYNLLKISTGEFLMTPEAAKCSYYIMSHTTSRQTYEEYKQYYFSTGDGRKNSQGTQVSYSTYFYTSALFNDPVMLALAKSLTNNYLLYSAISASPSFMACFISSVDYNGESMRDGIETIQYFGYPAASMTAREEWDNPDSPVVLMRMLNLTMANHEGRGHGTFHIYYKGLLTGSSGSYGQYTYGSAVHKYYSQATIAENGLLIYNPSRASNFSTNAERYYYSGSQRILGEAGTLANWTSGNYVMSETTGAAWGYDDNGNSKYAYIAGDLTKAYESGTIDYVSRSMFTLFTESEDFPMLFFTFDRIASDSANYTKHWLLHTVKEPTINTSTLTATVLSGEGGKMYVKSLFGADAMVKIGGKGKAMWINGNVSSDIWSTSIGKNLSDENSENYSDIFWGRIEIRAVGEKYTKFLTVMAVTDEGNTATFNVEKFTNTEETIFGAIFEDNVIAFMNDNSNYKKYTNTSISFNVSGKGLRNYYIAGVENGLWNVLVNGVVVATILSEGEEHFLNFTAPAGNITIQPAGTASAAAYSEVSEETVSTVAYAGNAESENVSAVSECTGEYAPLAAKLEDTDALVCEKQLFIALNESCTEAVANDTQDKNKVLIKRRDKRSYLC